LVQERGHERKEENRKGGKTGVWGVRHSRAGCRGRGEERGGGGGGGPTARTVRSGLRKKKKVHHIRETRAENDMKKKSRRKTR